MSSSLTLDERLSVIEQAWAVHTGHNLSEFDPQEAVAHRKAALADAAQKAADALAAAATVLTEPLSDQDRIARLEAAFRSAVGINI